MGKLLDVELYRYNNVVFGKILGLDGSLRGKGYIETFGGYSVCSYSTPQITDYEFYVWGTEVGEDDRSICNEFDSESEAIEYVEVITKLVDLINSKTKKPSSDVERVI